MSAHTPGPWTVDYANGMLITASLEGRFGEEWESREVARMRASRVTPRWEADAALISAAPDLLRALRAVHVRRIAWPKEIEELVVSALAKAESK